MQAASPISNQTNALYAIPAFTDNYIWCLHNDQHAIVVDPGEAQPVLSFLAQRNITLAAILITHHHFDHVGGIAQLIEQFPDAIVYGPHNPNIKHITNRLREGDTLTVPALNLKFEVLETPGHTLDHIVYVDEQHLFCGDTLFSAGCGRMFEGTPAMFYASLEKLRALPSHLLVCCTHEYTAANVAFASHVEPDNSQLIEYAHWVASKRSQQHITLPSTIAQQCEINPFLRCHTNSIQDSAHIKISEQEPTGDISIATFAALRALKDNF